MLVTVQHLLTGRMVSKEIDVTQDQLDNYYAGGVLLQYAFPHLSAADREFIKTGIESEEWDQTMKDPEDEEEDEEDEGLDISDAEALASAGRGTDEDYRPDTEFNDIPF